MENIDIEDVHEGEREAVLETIAEQSRELHERDTVVVTCPCGIRKILRTMFRCYYCEVYFCKDCAEDHFEEEEDQ